MKIKRITPTHVAIPYEHGAPRPIQTSGRERTTMDAVYVKVETDAGVVGWGEAYGFGSCAITAQAIRLMIAPLVEGLELSSGDKVTREDVAAFMQVPRRKTQSAGLNGPVSFASSGLDIALWDIAGKTQGLGVHQLVGNAGRTRVPAYASMMKLGVRAHLEKVLGIAQSRGFEHFKLHERTVDAVIASREIIGPDAGLMVDSNCAFFPDQAMEFAERVKHCRLTWFEEPIYPPDDYAALAKLRRVGIPIAVGENLGTVNEVRRLLEANAVDFVQPDACKIGGITELMRAADVAHAAGVHIDPHAPYYGPGLIASVHCLAGMTDGSLCEYFFADLVERPLGDIGVPRDGFIEVPKNAGLGIEVDERLLAKYAVS